MSGGALEVSVVVPVRDDPRIDGLLRSLASQESAPPHEILVALDGSRRRPRVPPDLPSRLLDLPARGPYAARNAAAREARGEILLFTDSDCLCPPDWIARAAEAFRDPELAALQGSSAASGRGRLSRHVQLEYERYVQSHAGRPFCNLRNFGIRAAVMRDLPLPDRFSRGGDGVYGRRLAALRIPIRYDPDWKIEHRHPEARWREAARAFEEGFCGALWKKAEGVDLFGDSAGSGPGAFLLKATAGSAAARRFASLLLLPAAGILAALSAVLPERAAAVSFHRFRRAAHLAGRLAGETVKLSPSR